VAVGGALGALAFWRRRQRKAAELPPAGPDPADELRAKLAESRTVGEDDEAEPVAEAERSPLDPGTRRQSVHDSARASIDELK
jgi:hypothetical protein